MTRFASSQRTHHLTAARRTVSSRTRHAGGLRKRGLAWLMLFVALQVPLCAFVCLEGMAEPGTIASAGHETADETPPCHGSAASSSTTSTHASSGASSDTSSDTSSDASSGTSMIASSQGDTGVPGSCGCGEAPNAQATIAASSSSAAWASLAPVTLAILDIAESQAPVSAHGYAPGHPPNEPPTRLHLLNATLLI